MIKIRCTNLHDEGNRMFHRHRQLNAKKTFVDRLAFLISSVHRACSHDAPKNFVLPLLEHHRLVGSCLVITRRRTGTTTILVVSERGVGARLGNIRSRKNTKFRWLLARYRRLNIGVFKHDRTAKVTWIPRAIAHLHRGRVTRRSRFYRLRIRNF